MVGRWFFMIIGTIFSITPAFVYWLAGWLTIQNDPTAPTIGDIVAFTTLQSRLFFPVGQLLNVQVEIQGALALFDRIFEYLEMDPRDRGCAGRGRADPDAVHGQRRVPRRVVPLPDAGRALADGRRRWRERGRAPGARDSRRGGRGGVGRRGRAGGSRRRHRPVVMAASAALEPIPTFGLEHIDFDAAPGELVALVGPSGSGKTTTTYLIPRLYDVDAGAVEIDGIDVRKIKLASLGEIIGVVTQETYLFHASVRDNLLYAQPDATEDELDAATTAAAMHDRVMELPEGYDTIVGERGYKLSGGEKQRIAIARVLLKDPRILILDEATSALDTVSERLIQAAFERLMEGRTTIAIAHRLSTILRADRILVYERGHIVERGTHAELLAQGGLYARLYREQFLTEANEGVDTDVRVAG